jgi:ketopantoate reductase
MSSLLFPTTPEKEFNICLVGSGGVGTIAALVLEKSGRARVTAVLRSKFDIVNEQGWDIESVDHGRLKNWKPSRGEPEASKLRSNERNQGYLMIAQQL